MVEPNLSTAGIKVLADTLQLNGGTINSAVSQQDADLSQTASTTTPTTKSTGSTDRTEAGPTGESHPTRAP